MEFCVRNSGLGINISQWALHKKWPMTGAANTVHSIRVTLITRSVLINTVNLQSADLIKYQPGYITIVGRPGLEEFSCECYEMLRRRNGD